MVSKPRQRGRLTSNSSNGSMKAGMKAVSRKAKGKAQDRQKARTVPDSQGFLRRLFSIPVMLLIVLVAAIWIVYEKQTESEKSVNNDVSSEANLERKDEDMKERFEKEKESTGKDTAFALPPEAANFKASSHRKLTPKSISIEKKKITFQRLKHNNTKSHVNVYIAENFLSDVECDGLSAAHSHHVLNANKKSPILCFDSVKTLNKHFHDIGYKYKATPMDFTEKTTCLNVSLSQELRARIKWSYSTAFYPGESKFSYIFETRIKEATGLPPSHGGKFQVTSYPQGIGYKNHTDCTEDSDTRDRFATILVYLQNVKEGGETKFPELGINVKPKKGRLLVWNSMTPDGKCDPTSVHNAAEVVKGHKFIIQRWYYYQNFYSLGKRPPEPKLPKREAFQPRVSCDEYEQGSCRWYDEWGYDHLIEYNMIKHKLS